MFSKMPVNDLPKDRKVYQKIVSILLSGMPEIIHAKEVVEENYLFYRVYFGEFETNFYITAIGCFVYYEKEFSLLRMMSKTDILTELSHFERDSKESDDSVKWEDENNI